MRKNHIKNVILALCVITVGLVSGCRNEDYLYPTSRTAVDSGNAFASADRIEAQINGVYNALKHGQFYGGRYLIYNDIRAENFINRTSNGVTGLQTYEHNLANGTNEIKNLWYRGYVTINNANLFLDGMEGGGNDVVGEPMASQYKAEARFLRAVSYYSLLQFFAQPYAANGGSSPGLPLRLTGNVGADDYSLERSSVADVYTQIIADLDFAEQNLPETQGDAFMNTTRAHKNTAIAFKTRVYLSMGNYSSVISEGNKIVGNSAPFTSSSGVALALAPNVRSVFQPPYTTDESIFSMPMTANSAPGTQNALMYYYMGNTEYTLNENGIIANSGWLGSDARRGFVGENSFGDILTKFPTDNPWTDYVPVIRYAEVLLNLGEAVARSTNGVDTRAVSLLNAVRNRSDGSTTFSVSDFGNAQALYDAFLTERNIEFLGEGIRSIDILRLGLPFPAKGTVSAIEASSDSYIWPISEDELIYNPLMTDN